MTVTRTASRRIIGAFGALAIALGAMTATAVPARANSDDLAKVIAGVAALAIIGSVLNDNDKGKHHHWAPPTPPRPGYHKPQPPRPPVVHHKPRPPHHHAQPPRPQQQAWHKPQPPRPQHHGHRPQHGGPGWGPAHR